MPEEAVSNSGPLIHLAQIDQLDLLGLCSKIFIPSEVYSEVTAFDPSLKVKIDRAKNIEKVRVAPRILDLLARDFRRYNLDPGELQAIALCQELGKKLFFTDDLDAREAAAEIGLEPHGSVGIIALAHQKSRLSFESAEKALHDLYEISNLFVTRSVIDIGISELKKFKK